MTDIMIVANRKPHYHFRTTRDMTPEEIEAHIENNLFRVDGVIYETTVVYQTTITNTL